MAAIHLIRAAADGLLFVGCLLLLVLLLALGYRWDTDLDDIRGGDWGDE